MVLWYNNVKSNIKNILWRFFAPKINSLGAPLALHDFVYLYVLTLFLIMQSVGIQFFKKQKVNCNNKKIQRRLYRLLRIHFYNLTYDVISFDALDSSGVPRSSEIELNCCALNTKPIRAVAVKCKVALVCTNNSILFFLE